MIDMYNNTKFAIDRLDSFVSRYCYMIKTSRWPHRVFSYLIFMCAVNAHVIYKISNPEQAGMKLADFIRLLSERLMAFMQDKRRESHHYITRRFFELSLEVDQVRERHHGGRRDPRYRCKRCKNRARASTMYYCYKCAVFCCPNCFSSIDLCNDCLGKLENVPFIEPAPEPDTRKETRSQAKRKPSSARCAVAIGEKRCNVLCHSFCEELSCRRAFCAAHRGVSVKGMYCSMCKPGK